MNVDGFDFENGYEIVKDDFGSMVTFKECMEESIMLEIVQVLRASKQIDQGFVKYGTIEEMKLMKIG